MADQAGVAVMETGALEFRTAETDDVDERREAVRPWARRSRTTRA